MQAGAGNGQCMRGNGDKVLGSDRRLARNTLWNLLGQGLPLLAAVFAIPILVQQLGTERFGILTLIWVVIGYFSVFDLGLGRALTQLVAGKLEGPEAAKLAPLVWTALTLMSLFGLIGMGVLMLAARPAVTHLLKVGATMQGETGDAIAVLALSLPIVVLTSALRGILEATQNFGRVNALRVPLGVATFVGPLLVLPYSTSLVPVTAVLLLIRVVALFAHWRLCLGVLPALRQWASPRRDDALALLRFGGWMTVTNLVGPAMVYLDRFLIGGLLSMAAVAYYVAPYELVTKLSMFPAAVSTALFPALAAASAPTSTGASTDRGKLYRQGLGLIFAVMGPATLVVAVFARQILGLWLGPDFATEGERVLQLLALGVMLNALAVVPFALIQGLGRPDITAKIHLLELPFYVAAMLVLVSSYGIVGIALAWTLRVGVDTLAMFLLAAKLAPELHRRAATAAR